VYQFKAQASWFRSGPSGFKNVSNVRIPYVPGEWLEPLPSLASEMLWPWITATRDIWTTISRLIEPAVNENHISSVLFQLSTIASEFSGDSKWTLSGNATLKPNQTLGIVIPLWFPGKLEYSANVSALNAFLGISSRPDFNADEFWEYIGRMMYIIAWIYYSDLGQVQDALFGNPESSQDPIASQNPFVNPTLYNDFVAYVDSRSAVFNTPGVEPVNRTLDTPLQQTKTEFIVDYTCEVRRLRSPATLIIFVMTSDYALIVGAYQAVIWVAALFQKRYKNGEL
jgi:hypothetical protein